MKDNDAHISHTKFRMASKLSTLFKSPHVITLCSRNISCWTAGITKKHKRIYIQTYPTLLQQPDGSVINIQYHEPVKAIKLPFDLRELTEDQQKARLLKRIPKTKVKFQEEIEDDFDESRYLKYKKK